MTQITTIPALLAMLRDTLKIGLDTITLHHNEVHLLLTEMERLDKENERLLNELREANTVYTNMAEDDFEIGDRVMNNQTLEYPNFRGGDTLFIPLESTGEIVEVHEPGDLYDVQWDSPLSITTQRISRDNLDLDV